MTYTKKEFKCKLKLQKEIASILVSFADMDYKDAEVFASREAREIIEEIRLNNAAIEAGNVFYKRLSESE